ncbi:MAG TPA: hypothetical protein VFL93_10590 [Longimicrobiaceae bacterium]|nr:hypothetical protein [Longimicrobiaceae bacterium]
MAAISTSAWKTIIILAAIALLIAGVVTGYLVWGIALVVILLILGGGALLYRSAGPPER